MQNHEIQAQEDLNNDLPPQEAVFDLRLRAANILDTPIINLGSSLFEKISDFTPVYIQETEIMNHIKEFYQKLPAAEAILSDEFLRKVRAFTIRDYLSADLAGLFMPAPFLDMGMQYFAQFNQGPQQERNELPDRNMRLPNDQELAMGQLRDFALLDPGNDLSVNSLTTISKNENRLEQLGVPTEWIPREYTCAMFWGVIDGTPIYAGGTSERYDYKNLLDWIKNNGTHPVTGKPLREADFQYDYELEDKISDYICFIQSSTKALKELSPSQAARVIEEFVEHQRTETLDLFFQKYGASPKLEKSLTYNYAAHFKQSFFCSKTLNNSTIAENSFFVIKFIKEFANPYQILGIDETYTPIEIMKAYRKLSLQYHPDKNPDQSSGQKFILIQEAKNILVNEKQREILDTLLNLNEIVNCASKLQISL